MRNPLRIFLWATVVMFSLPQAYSQQASSSDKDHQTAKKQSKQGKKAATELGDTRKEWLEQDAKYIITPAEREAFLKLGTNEERDQFIETFWRNRNPDPESPENSFKEEHYRRIAYANEHFASGVPGWRTDRIQPAERMTGRCGKGAAQRRRMRGNFGVIAVSRNSVTTSNSNLSSKWLRRIPLNARPGRKGRAPPCAGRGPEHQRNDERRQQGGPVFQFERNDTSCSDRQRAGQPG